MSAKAGANARSMSTTPAPLATPSVDLAIATVATALEVSVRALRLQTLLHLPRLACANSIDVASARREAERLALQLRTRVAPVSDFAAAPPQPPTSVHDLRFAPADEEIARLVEERFHYLASFRADAAPFGVYADDKLAALVSVSPLDLAPLIAALPAGVEAKDVRVISRVFAFDWAPANTITYLLARVVRQLSKEEGTRLLLTYLNPNLGFTGASYRAANWTLYAHEHGTRYAYLDCDYITDRRLQDRFGSANPIRLRAQLGERITFSRLPLVPLELYASFADRRLRRASRAPLEVRRPEL